MTSPRVVHFANTMALQRVSRQNHAFRVLYAVTYYYIIFYNLLARLVLLFNFFFFCLPRVSVVSMGNLFSPNKIFKKNQTNKHFKPNLFFKLVVLFDAHNTYFHSNRMNIIEISVFCEFHFLINSYVFIMDTN